MSDTEIRAIVVAGVALVAILVVWLVRRYIDQQRRLVIAASVSGLSPDQLAGVTGPVRILAFSSDDCRQCHTLQAPALHRVLAARGERLQVTEVDAPTSIDLVEQYRVLTLPSTVVLDGAGQVHAVNYGFANTEQLLRQVDKVLARIESKEGTATTASGSR